MDLSKSKVLITGGSSGIGYETAKLLRSQGAQVVICGRNAQTIEKAAQELDVFGIQADVSKEDDVEKLFAFTLDKLSDLNVLINNAGIGFMGSLVETSVADFTRIWEINLKSAFLCGQAAAKYFISKNTGNILNISSMGALKGFANGSAYVSSKAAMSGLTMCWQAELRKHNIRVTQVNPSEVITDFAVKLGYESVNPENKLKAIEIAQAIVGVLAINDIGFIPEINVWATNP
ncbi:SDR family oxidoreductase [Arcticibacter eurypsychrophilus]|uniref:SDR family oxidoreductase n=1 Tax=Arcticibacter eurypsychrophilus TaxID=1434752 RepID=UPI00084DDC9E|nr:SDR family oxidoreductase [Arcticibacter eurypsychrophilus]